MIERAVKHPDFEFDPAIHQNLANELYDIFMNKSPAPSSKGWSERARVMAARILGNLHRLNLANQVQQNTPQLHLHQHAPVDPEECRAQILAAIDAEVARRKIPPADGPSDNGDGRRNGDTSPPAS